MRKYPKWHGVHDLKEKVEIHVGQLFANPSKFKEALQLYAVQNCFDYTYMHNDKQRVSAYSNRYIDSFRDQPNWKASALKEAVRRDYNVELTLLACHRAKRMALKLLAGSDDGQYKLTRAYCNALRQWNPSSSTYIQRNGLFFKRMYVSLDACKRGFLAGCRPMICVDACFMKGQHGGQLHAAIARDGNNDIFPIAYVLCETESRGTWTWFLNSLLEDIGNPREHTWSFMSNKQKGLMEAIEYLMPDVEHRLCVRHLHANFKNKGYKGKAYKDALWGAARVINENQFKYYMSVIKGIDTAANEYIANVNPKMWSRHAFRETSCSDILLNNTAETFNAWVLEARDQPILTCMEMIRRQLMNRISQKRNGAATSTNIICPKIVKKLDRNKSDARNYISHWSNDLTFEVDHRNEARRVVNLKSRTCGCCRWQKNGIPCPHACCAIYQNRETPEKYVSDCYLMDTYKKSYAYSIEPMPNPKDWAINNDDEVTLPPLPKKQRGRLKKLGHNARSCTRPQNPNRKIYPKKVKKPQLNIDTEGGTSQTMHPIDIPQSTATASGQSRRLRHHSQWGNTNLIHSQHNSGQHNRECNWNVVGM
ncbi:uncharacterized protein LOC132165776 [Corylus avellana]|uniref:uncharacterized protein LOC132165776 n=1 Tax=Corylus avellana TaxID=13451 RepID=UPI00286AE424|nr:uncharacterized protein LOC132165776 [Corylus avellana]